MSHSNRNYKEEEDPNRYDCVSSVTSDEDGIDREDISSSPEDRGHHHTRMYHNASNASTSSTTDVLGMEQPAHGITKRSVVAHDQQHQNLHIHENSNDTSTTDFDGTLTGDEEEEENGESCYTYATDPNARDTPYPFSGALRVDSEARSTMTTVRYSNVSAPSSSPPRTSQHVSDAQRNPADNRGLDARGSITFALESPSAIPRLSPGDSFAPAALTRTPQQLPTRGNVNIPSFYGDLSSVAYSADTPKSAKRGKTSRSSVRASNEVVAQQDCTAAPALHDTSSNSSVVLAQCLGTTRARQQHADPAGAAQQQQQQSGRAGNNKSRRSSKESRSSHNMNSNNDRTSSPSQHQSPPPQIGKPAGGLLDALPVRIAEAWEAEVQERVRRVEEEAQRKMHAQAREMEMLRQHHGEELAALEVQYRQQMQEANRRDAATIRFLNEQLSVRDSEIAQLRAQVSALSSAPPQLRAASPIPALHHSGRSPSAGRATDARNGDGHSAPPSLHVHHQQPQQVLQVRHQAVVNAMNAPQSPTQRGSSRQQHVLHLTQKEKASTANGARRQQCSENGKAAAPHRKCFAISAIYDKDELADLRDKVAKLGSAEIIARTNSKDATLPREVTHVIAGALSTKVIAAILRGTVWITPATYIHESFQRGGWIEESECGGIRSVDVPSLYFFSQKPDSLCVAFPPGLRTNKGDLAASRVLQEFGVSVVEDGGDGTGASGMACRNRTVMTSQQFFDSITPPFMTIR